MDSLIQATKDGDQSKFQELSGGVLSTLDNEDEVDEETSEEDEEEVRNMRLLLFLTV